MRRGVPPAYIFPQVLSPSPSSHLRNKSSKDAFNFTQNSIIRLLAQVIKPLVHPILYIHATLYRSGGTLLLNPIESPAFRRKQTLIFREGGDLMSNDQDQGMN